MIKIQNISTARENLKQPRFGVKEYVSDPNFDFKDKIVVVLGNSPALNIVDLRLLNKVFTIGVNRICRVYTPNVLLFTDPPILKAEEESFRAFKGPILFWQNYEPSWIQSSPNARYFMLAPMMHPNLWNWPKSLKDPLIREGSTPSYAIQLAILGGAKAVGLLGTDFSAPILKNNGKLQTHFYGDGNKMQSTGAGTYEQHKPFYDKVPEWAEKFGCKVFNLSPYSDTPIHKANWPKLSLEEFVKNFVDQ